VTSGAIRVVYYSTLWETSESKFHTKKRTQTLLLRLGNPSRSWRQDSDFISLSNFLTNCPQTLKKEKRNSRTNGSGVNEVSFRARPHHNMHSTLYTGSRLPQTPTATRMENATKNFDLVTKPTTEIQCIP
jgi:hypothetical protein